MLYISVKEVRAMFKRKLAVCAVLAMAPVAGAGVMIEVIDPAGPGATHPAGSTIPLDIYLTQDPVGDEIGIRGLGFSFSLTEAETSNFAFDYSSITMGDEWYEDWPDRPLPATVYFSAAPTEPLNLGMLVLPESDPLHAASFDLTLPTADGLYVLDLIHAAPGHEDDPNHTFWLYFGFGLDPNDPITIWWPGRSGASQVGIDSFAIADGESVWIPEPTSLSLIVLGGIAALCRRRGAPVSGGG